MMTMRGWVYLLNAWIFQDLESNKAQLDKIKEKISELEEIVQASNERKNLEEQVGGRYSVVGLS